MICQSSGPGIKTVIDSCSNPWASIDCPEKHFEIRKHFAERIYLFLLGYPFTGTSAVYFVLANNSEVSSPTACILGGEKEGWRIPIEWNGKSYPRGFVSTKTEKERWQRDLEVPWNTLKNAYHSHWNLSSKILIECSPPEILHTQELIDNFSPTGNVRFILLTRSPCNIGNTTIHKLAANQEQPYWPTGPITVREQHHILQQHGDRTFVLRYEDICSNATYVSIALEKWLPGLSLKAINYDPPIVSYPKKSMSIAKFCQQVALPSWPSENTLYFNATEDHVQDIRNALTVIGYEGTIERQLE